MNNLGHYHIGKAFFVKEKMDPAITIDLPVPQPVLVSENSVDRLDKIPVNWVNSSTW